MTTKRLRDAHEIQKKKVLNALFKKVVRRIIINSQWLDGDNDDDQKMSNNFRKNITLLMRTKRKIGMLTLNDKSLIRKPHQLRTISERRKLCTLFAGLKCFAWIPPILRARLVPVSKFITLNTGRTVMRQGDIPLTVFFIVSGEVQMIKIVGSQFSKKIESKGEIIFGPGDCIGDVEMMEDYKRTHTFITTSQCELLLLFDYDFIAILKPYMQKNWNQKKKALKALDYFDFLNEDQILKACKLCSLKEYKPLDTIYCQDRGTLTNVCFVLSGECIILQCLNMKVNIKNGKKIYELADSVDENNCEVIGDIDSTKSLVKHNSSTSFDMSEKHRIRKFAESHFECRMPSLNPTINTSSITSYTKYCEEETMLFPEEKIEDIESYSSYSTDSSTESLNMSINGSELHINLLPIKSEMIKNLTSLGSALTSSSTMEFNESHFIDVGSITFGGIFGLGENMHDRVILARNTVQCLLLPRFFLLHNEQNPENIWQRRLFYLDCIIPSRESLFDDFLQTLKWKKFKNDFIYRNVISKADDIARGDDIPILCRIEEDGDH